MYPTYKNGDDWEIVQMAASFYPVILDIMKHTYYSEFAASMKQKFPFIHQTWGI